MLSKVTAINYDLDFKKNMQILFFGQFERSFSIRKYLGLMRSIMGFLSYNRDYFQYTSSIICAAKRDQPLRYVVA